MKLPLAIACVSALAITVPSSAAAAQTLKLDLANPANEVPGAVAVQSAPLVAGQAYVVRISGSGSLWSPADTPQGITCGTPDTKPIIEPTPGAAASVAAIDPALVFAAPVGAFLYGHAACQDSGAKDIPYASGLLIGTKGALKAAVPVGGVPTAPNPTHTYEYEVTGDGTPLQFQLADVRADDNSGIFTIDVLTKAECTAQACLPPVTTTPTTPAPTASSAVCTGKGKVAVQLVLKKGQKVSRAGFWVNNRLRALVSGGKLTASDGTLKVQTLAGLPDGQLKIKVIVRLTDRKLVRYSAVVKSCGGASTTPVSLV